MSLTYNNTAVKKVTLNGDDVKHLDYNGTRTWDAYRTMTVYINENEPDPDLRCTYGDDAVGMTPGSDDWDEFFGHYPVMLKDGIEGKALQRNNFAIHEDGTVADITSGTEGDVMICFPLRGLSITKDTLTNTVKITMTDNLENLHKGQRFAFMRREYTNWNSGHWNSYKDHYYDKFYAGAYFVASDEKSILSGKTPINYKGYDYKDAYNRIVVTKGSPASGYYVCGWDYCKLRYLQAMFLLKYKTCKIKNVLGEGANYNTNITNTGTCNNKGMDCSGDDNNHMKLFGIEDFVGWKNVHITGINGPDGVNASKANTQPVFSLLNVESLDNRQQWMKYIGRYYDGTNETKDEYSFYPATTVDSDNQHYYCASFTKGGDVFTIGERKIYGSQTNIFGFYSESKTCNQYNGFRLIYVPAN